MLSRINNSDEAKCELRQLSKYLYHFIIDHNLTATVPSFVPSSVRWSCASKSPKHMNRCACNCSAGQCPAIPARRFFLDWEQPRGGGECAKPKLRSDGAQIAMAKRCRLTFLARVGLSCSR